MKGKAAKILKSVGIAVVCLCILSYSVFHIASFFSEEIGTVVVGPTTEKTTVSISGFIFRDATPIYAESYMGAVDYLVKNGEKVARGGELAVVYEEGNSSEVDALVDILDEQIDLLRLSVDKKPSLSELSALRSNASSAYYSIMSELAGGMNISLNSDKTKLLVALNSVATLTDENFNIKETLDNLLTVRENLLAAGGESEKVSAEKSGYFYTGVDGYEDTFNASAATSFTREGFLGLFDAPENYQKSVDDRCIGKMSYNAVWYYAAEISAEDAARFNVGERYAVEFTGGGRFEIDMDVIRVLVDEGEERAVIVLSSSILPDDFNFRMQTAKIVTDSVSGIYIPKDAVHRVGGSKVVYILKGSVVKMRYIDVVYEGADYYLVRENVVTEEEDKRIFLKSNELLIIKGSNLFDGRILG